MDHPETQHDQRCSHCGTALTGETTGGLCPRCLLEMNFASRTMPGGEPSPQLPPPSPEEMADRFPQFEILECLGRGGMGIVYKARQKTLDRLVAIKVLAGERHDDPQFEARFSREARTLAKLSHPNIVTVHDFGKSDGMFYLVMEFVDGVNLRDVLRDGRMEPAQALAIVPSICEALQFAHDHGVVHRDIKPENILMDRDGRVKIADFGIATLVGATAERSGTPPYMAPEQEAADGTVDHRADIYALGVVFYEMLTGERPEQDPSRPSRRVEIDVRLDEIVLRALEKEPEQRYQTAGEFRTMVETVAAPDTSAAIHTDASAAGPQPHGRWRGIDRRSKRTLFGLPLWHVATGVDPGTGRMRTARGIVAIGDRAQGVVAIGGVAMGGFAFGGFSIGVVSIGGFSAGLFVMGGFGLALIAAFAGFAMAPIALGGVAVGWYASGGQGFGAHVTSAMAKDPEAVRFFDSWAVPLMTTAGIANIAIIAFILLLGVGLPLWMQRRSAPPSQDPAGKQRRTLAALVGIIAFTTVGAAALLCWLQRPVMIDGRTLSADSPDGMQSARGQTWRTMRIFDSDRTFYRFTVQGRAGAVWEKWEVAVPYDKLATSYVLLSIDEILFGKHGRIVWSDDSKRASFQVNGIEVAGFDTETGKPTEAGGAQDTPEQVAHAFMDAMRSGDIDAAMACMGTEMKAMEGIRKVMEEASGELVKTYAEELERLTEFTEWYPEKHDANTRFIGTRIAGTSGKNVRGMKGGLYLILSPTPEGWKLAHIDDVHSDKPLSYYVDRIVRIIPGEGPEIRGASAEVPEMAPAQAERVVRNVLLPDADRKDVPTVLDLASGELLDVPVEGEGEIINYFNKLGRGDLAWDNALITLRGAKVNEWNDGVWDLLVPEREEMGCASYRFRLPKRLLVTTAEGTRYTVDVRAGIKDGVRIEFQRGEVLPEVGDSAEIASSDGIPASAREGDLMGRAQALPVTPPAAMPEGSPLTVEQLKKVLEGVTWGEFIAAFADDGHGHEVSWKEAAPEGADGTRFEVTFTFGGEKMLIDLDVDPNFRRATASRLRSAKRPDKIKADAAEFLPQMAIRYAVQSDHPAAAPAMERIRERVHQAKTLSTMREYATAIAICQADTAALPPALDTLVERKYIREATLMMNHDTGKMEPPLYHGRPDLRVEDLDASKTILLAAPSADQSGKRVVGFLDSHVDAIDEADYQAQLKAQQKPPLERTGSP